MNWSYLIGAVVGLLACGAFYFSYKYYRIRQLIREIPTSPINRIGSQLAEIKGRAVEGDRPLVSPASQQPCVYFQVKIEEYRHRRNSRGRSSGSWRTIHRKESNDPIYLEDSTGQARINLKGAEKVFAEDSSERAGGFWEGDFPPHIQGYLSSVGISQSSFFGLASRRLRCTETFVATGDELYVIGYGSRYNDLVQFQKQKGMPLIISDYQEEKLGRHYLLYSIGAAVGGIALLIGSYFILNAG